MTEHRGDVLVADDDRSIADGLREVLNKYMFRARAVYSGADAIREVAFGRYDVLVIDWIMPGSDGRDVVDFVRRTSPETTVIVHSGYDTSDAQATISGAHEFVDKGLSPEPILHAVERGINQAHERRESMLAAEACYRPEQWFIDAVHEEIPRTRFERHGGILAVPGGVPDAIRRWIACGDGGESQPFQEINCRHSSGDALEETLHGFVRFRGDEMPFVRRGLAELASGGTLCVRNVHMLPEVHQRRLADSVARGETRRIGSDRAISVKIRLLMTVESTLPPQRATEKICPELRELVRPEWMRIPDFEQMPDARAALVERMIKSISGSRRHIGPSVAAVFRNCAFKGPLGDLKYAVERAFEIGGAGKVEIEELGFPVVETEIAESRGGHTKIMPWERAQAAFEAFYLYRVLSETGGNISRAAKLAGIGRQSMHRAIKKHNISAADLGGLAGEKEDEGG